MLRVFLVEDESIIRETLRDTVPWAQCGYSFVGEASDGEMALPLIRKTTPDVLITDIRMPFMDGLELSRRVLEEFPDMKIIIISGYDDFDYAQKAIDIGVERYLLKPITKNTLIGVLQSVREKAEEELARKQDSARMLENKEYERYARRDFFERMVTGKLPEQRIHEEAAQMGLNLRAESYALAFLAVMPEKPDAEAAVSETLDRVRGELLESIREISGCVPVVWNLSACLVLVCSAKAKIQYTLDKLTAVTRICCEGSSQPLGWHIALGEPADSIMQLPERFREVSRLWAYRYLMPQQNVLTNRPVAGQGSLDQLDAGKLNPRILMSVMQSAAAEEIPNFVSEYLREVGQALESAAFCQYLTLSVRFTAMEFAAGLGVSQQQLGQELDTLGRPMTAEELKIYMTEALRKAVQHRENNSTGRYRGILNQAAAFIDEHFSDEKLSLNQVAREVNISPNYLSAMFSQEMGCTFVEYVTARRMERAKQLLRSSDLRSGEVAAAVGYKDPHYFSFLFKKTQGCTPRDYRAGGKQG